ITSLPPRSSPVSASSPSLFFFNTPAPPALYPLSLHDALPISGTLNLGHGHPTVARAANEQQARLVHALDFPTAPKLKLMRRLKRSEEHTSELQSLTNLVCRLLLEKKKRTDNHVAHEQQDIHSS